MGVIRNGIARYSHINWTLLDQALVSGVNFFTSILLARYLGLQGFGVFTLVWMAVLFVNSLQFALVSSPMMSIGPLQPENESSVYYGSVLIQQVIVSSISFLLLLVGFWASGYYFSEWEVGGLAWPSACACFSFQMQDYLRRYFFTRGRITTVFISDLLSYGGQLLLLLLMFYSGLTTITNALWVIAITSFLAMLWGLLKLERHLYPSMSYFASNLKRHWKSSRWLAASALLDWTSGNLFFIAAGAILGAWATGTLRAALNLIGPVSLIFQTLLNLMPGSAARKYRSEGMNGLVAYIKKCAFGVTAVSVLYFLPIIVAPEFWLTLLYGGAYTENYSLVFWFCLAYTALASRVPIEIGLRTLERTKYSFWALTASTIFAIGTHNYLITRYGISGAGFGVLMSMLIALSVCFFGFRKEIMAAGLKI